jgi:hypothetical protein
MREAKDDEMPTVEHVEHSETSLPSKTATKHGKKKPMSAWASTVARKVTAAAMRVKMAVKIGRRKDMS